MVWEEGSWEVFVDNKSPGIIVKVEFMDQSLKMNENPSIFLLWKKNQDQDGPDYKVVLWVGRWHIWQNHCVILLLTCLLHSLFLSDTVYCECSNKLLLRELVKGKKREKEVYFSYLLFWHENPKWISCLFLFDAWSAMIRWWLKWFHSIWLITHLFTSSIYCKPIISSAFPCAKQWYIMLT